MAEDMLEEVEVITITGEDGQEEYYAVDVTIPYAGKEFAVLVPYSEEGDESADGDAIIARLDEEAKLCMCPRQMKNLKQCFMPTTN